MFGGIQQTELQQKQGGSHPEPRRTSALIFLARPFVWETGLVPQQTVGTSEPPADAKPNSFSLLVESHLLHFKPSFEKENEKNPSNQMEKK